jgi:hypothetical protein
MFHFSVILTIDYECLINITESILRKISLCSSISVAINDTVSDNIVLQ